MYRFSLVVLFCCATLACGGGGGGSNNNATPPPPPAQNLAVLDALPDQAAAMVDAGLVRAHIAHAGFADFSFTDGSDCQLVTTLQRNLIGVSDPAEDTLFDHKYSCDALDQNATIAFSLNARRGDGSDFVLDSEFSTVPALSAGLTVQDSVGATQAEIQDVFLNYLASQLLADLGLPASVALLLGGEILDLANDWVQLQNPLPIHNVIAQRVSYVSADPFGNAADTATGLVVWPDVTAGSFTPKSEVVILAHATGSTPSELDPVNAWYMSALVLASRGYVVIAPDNWGRGGTASAPETYLLGNRTAATAADLLRSVLAAEDLADLLDPDPSVAIVGYSQGGHSSMAIWQTLAAHQIAPVSRVFAGGGPYNLYGTFEGVMSYLNGTCAGGEYCRYVDDDTTVPFVTERVLPGLLNYTETGLSETDIVNGGVVEADFVTDFLANEPRIDQLKGILQLSTYTNIENLTVLEPGSTQFYLYHSDFDRLVPEANNAALVDLLNGQSVSDRSAVCNTSTYQTIFNTTTIIGISHALCGFAMIDDVLTELN